MVVVVVAEHDNPEGQRCPVCGGLNEAATGMTGMEGPREGDASICLYCGALCVFNADGTIRQTTEEETARMLADPMVARILDTIPRLHEEKNT